MAANLPDGSLESLVASLKLLADETRLRILCTLLAERELHVAALCDRLGHSQPAISHHLAILKSHGLIACRRSGKHNFYSVRSQPFGSLKQFVDRLCMAADGR